MPRIENGSAGLRAAAIEHSKQDRREMKCHMQVRECGGQASLSRRCRDQIEASDLRERKSVENPRNTTLSPACQIEGRSLAGVR